MAGWKFGRSGRWRCDPDLQCRSGVDAALSKRQLEDGIARDGIAKDGIPKDGIAKDGIPKDGIPKDGIARDGIPKDGILKVSLLRKSCTPGRQPKRRRLTLGIMAYNEQLSNRIREALGDQENVEEKTMFGGLCFMVNDKMCIGVKGDDMMCRIDTARIDEALEKPGCRQMDMSGKTMKGFVLVDEHGTKKAADFLYWVNLCLEFNPLAKASKKKK